MNYYKLPNNHPTAIKLRNFLSQENIAKQANIDFAKTIGATKTNGYYWCFASKPGKPWVKTKRQPYNETTYTPSQKTEQGLDMQAKIDALPKMSGWGLGAMIDLFGSELSYQNENESGTTVFNDVNKYGIPGFKLKDDCVYYHGDTYWFLGNFDGVEEITNIQYRE